MRGEPDTLTPTNPPSRSLRLLVGGAVATVVVGFVVGFAIGGRSGGGDAVTASGPSPSSSSTSSAPATTEEPTTTSAPAAPSSTVTTTTTAPTTTATTAVTTAPTTEVPVTTSVVPFPTIATTASPPTTAPPAIAPSRVVVSYATDGRGRLIIPRAGSANLVVTNEGGLPQQWLVTGTGFGTVGPTQGTLGAGQTVTVTVVAPPGELVTSEINGVISVLGAVNPTVPFVIPAR